MSKLKPNASMEKQQFLDFFAAALQDESLLEQLMAFVDVKDNEAIIRLARERGYSFSQESLRQGIKNIVNLVAPVDKSGKLKMFTHLTPDESV